MLAADYIVDLGPEGGAGGGTIVAQGSPEEIARNKVSHTAKVLREALKSRKPSAHELERGAEASPAP
jgi:excinuclease ABC subunit A